LYTIGQLAKKSGLSRSTLLYYDSLGVLHPSGRSASNYRLYTEDDLDRLQKILVYRDMGVSLDKIPAILTSSIDDNVSVFEKVLEELNEKIQRLRRQQYAIVRFLNDEQLLNYIRVINKDTWMALLQSIGMDDAKMHLWHVNFERISPSGHQDFLEAMGLPESEIKLIRERIRRERRENNGLVD
jgi:DNA-binding transcriptional MerR regulator